MELTGKNYKLYNADCVDAMDLLIKEGVQIDLTVTSPPYDNMRTYNNSLDWNFDIFKSIAQKLYKLTKSGGVVVWIVGDATKNFSETNTSFKQALYFKDIGFNLLDTMIYLKENYPPLFPSARRYSNQFDYMFILSKGKPITFNPKQILKKRKLKGKKVIDKKMEN